MRNALAPILILALAGGAPAVETVVAAAGADALAPAEAALRLHGTPLRWPAGTMTLAEAAGRLAVAGNRVVLGDGLDPAASRPLPALDGLWWEGVLLVARTWGADLLPAEAADGGTPDWVEHADGSGGRALRLVPTWSPPVLAAGGRTLRALAGPCLLEWPGPEVSDGEPGTLVHGPVIARIEPRLADPGRMTVHLRRTLTDGELPGPEDGAVIVGPDGELLAALDLRLDCPWTATGALASGDRLRVPLPEGSMSVERSGDAVVVVLAGDREDRRIVDDIAFGPVGGSLRPASFRRERRDEGTALIFAFTDPPPGPLEVRIRGHRPVGTRSSTPTGLDLAVLPAGPAGPSATRARYHATRVAWPGGPRTLTAAVAALQAGGNRLVLPFAADGSPVRDLPPYAGEWWGGVLLVARTWGYAVQPAESPGMAAGLVPGTTTGAAAGPWLIRVATVQRTEVRTAAGVDRRAAIWLRIDPEPRLGPPPEGMGITWATAAALDGGTTAMVEDDEDGDTDGMEGDGGRYATCLLRHLPDGPGTAVLAGMLQAVVGDPVLIETSLALGGVRRIDAGGVVWVVTLSPPGAAEQPGDGRRIAARLRITGPPDQAHAIDPDLADAAGTEFAAADRSVEGSTLVLDLATAPPDPLAVRIAASIDHGTVAVPFTIAIPLP